MPWGFAAMAVGTVASAAIQSNSAKKAAAAQQHATDSAMGEQARQYDQTRADFAPYRETGARALGQLETDINTPVTSSDVMSDPGYQFGMQQGEQALGRRIAAGGGRVSGAALKAAARFGNDYATSGYGAAYQRKQDRLNRLAALAGIGQTSTAASATAGSQKANAISSLLTAQGDATAASKIAQGSIWGNAVTQLGSMFGRGMGGGSGGFGGG